MPDDSGSTFAAAIYDHLELKRRNAALEYEMPLSRYMPWRAIDDDQPRKTDAEFEDYEDTLTNVRQGA
jgi:hypothetical protein